jgi:hypothetical protein
MSASKKGPVNPTPAVIAVTCVLASLLAGVSQFVGSHAQTGLTCAIVGVAVLGIVANRRLRVRQGERFVRENVQATEALARGDLAAARAGFTPWADQLWMSRATALARHNLAWVRMRQGELRPSLDLLTRNEAGFEGQLTAIGMSGTSAADLALLHVLVGDLEKAEHWLAIAEQRATKGIHLPSLAAMTTFSRAALHCRAGRFDDAVRLLDERWASCEGALTGGTLRPLRVLRGFAIASSNPRNAGLAEVALATSRPSFPGEYDFLGVEWPELAAFLAAHDLASA